MKLTKIILFTITILININPAIANNAELTLLCKKILYEKKRYTIEKLLTVAYKRTLTKKNYQLLPWILGYGLTLDSKNKVVFFIECADDSFKKDKNDMAQLALIMLQETLDVTNFKENEGKILNDIRLKLAPNTQYTFKPLVTFLEKTKKNQYIEIVKKIINASNK